MNRKAFTLVELAVVLTIIGLLVGSSFKVIKSMRERNSITEAKDAVKAAIDAITGDAIEWNTLITVPNFNQNLSPVKGITVSGVLKTPLHYFPDNTLLVTPICSRNVTNLNVIDNSVSPARIVQDVAFVVAHESSNTNMQTALDTTVTPNVVAIYGPATSVDDSTAYPNINRPADEYDDIVEWVTLAELQRNMRCNDKPLRIVNDKLPDADSNTTLAYSATIVLDGNFSAPSSHSCTFDPTYNSYFQYNTGNYTITNKLPPTVSIPTGTAVVNCSFTDGDITVSKPFVITINP